MPRQPQPLFSSPKQELLSLLGNHGLCLCHEPGRCCPTLSAPQHRLSEDKNTPRKSEPRGTGLKVFLMEALAPFILCSRPRKASESAWDCAVENLGDPRELQGQGSIPAGAAREQQSTPGTDTGKRGSVPTAEQGAAPQPLVPDQREAQQLPQTSESLNSTEGRPSCS